MMNFRRKPKSFNKSSHNMKKNLRKEIFRLSKYCLSVLILQLVFLNPAPAIAIQPASAERSVVDITISGTVTDGSGEPIPGVTVSIPGTNIGTATDLEGKYSLSVPEGSTLVFSFIGFESQTHAVGDQSIIDVQLTETISSLDEVVVV